MKTALIFGSSGLIGNQLLNFILKSDNYNNIKIFVRSVPEINNSKVEIIKTDFDNLDQFKDFIVGDDCFFCIGTTHKQTPDKNEYRKIEHDMPLKIAKIAKSNSIKKFIYVSSMGANPKASGSYLKNKGEAEEGLKNLNFPKLAIIRPSLLVGNRKTFRLGERIAIPIMNFMSLFFIGSLKKYKPIKIEYVTKAMMNIADKDYNEIIFESDKLEKIGKY